jgi:hypothetical protein
LRLQHAFVDQKQHGVIRVTLTTTDKRDGVGSLLVHYS